MIYMQSARHEMMAHSPGPPPVFPISPEYGIYTMGIVGICVDMWDRYSIKIQRCQAQLSGQRFETGSDPIDISNHLCMSTVLNK